MSRLLNNAEVVQGATRFGIAVLVVLVVWGVARALREIASRTLTRRGVRADVILLVNRVIYSVLIGLAGFFGIAIVLGNSGVAVSGVLVAAFTTALGLQDLFKSYVAGFYVLLERNIRIGDRVEVSGTADMVGEVTEVRMRVTYLRGEGGSVIVVPNTELFTRIIKVLPPGPGEAAPADPGRETA